MNKWVIGNWKMHGRKAMVREMLATVVADPVFNRPEVGFALPCVYVPMAADAVEASGARCRVFAQDVSRFAHDGAHTGEVSAEMLSDVGCQAVLIGHSERRQEASENAEHLIGKLNAVRLAGLSSVLCVGETLAHRESGLAEAMIAGQLNEVADELREASEVIVAYEPVWAIGTGLIASCDDVAAMLSFIKKSLLQILGTRASIRVLYGGSVKSSNVCDLLLLKNLDGVLVGGASLDIREFRKICLALEKS